MQHPNRLHHIRIICQRLPHPHKHHVGNALRSLSLRASAPSCLRAFLQYPIQPPHLLHNLRRRQIPLRTIDPTRAELAPHRTAHLRADARRPPCPIRNHHRLGIRSTPPDQQLLRPVAAALMPVDLSIRKCQPLFQKPPSRPRKVGHLTRLIHQLAVYPVPHLPRPKPGPPPGLCHCIKFHRPKPQEPRLFRIDQV